MFSNSTRRGLLAGAAILTLAFASPALAADKPIQTYDLKAQDLGQALAAVAQASGREIIASQTLVAGKTAPALKGRYTADEAFARLLNRSGLVLAPVGDKLVLRKAPATPAPGELQAGDAEVLSELVVTGTRIRGAGPVGSNLITLGRGDINKSGYATTQQVIQALPQNFGGGPNEATAGFSIRNGGDSNVALGTGVNLRGLGPSSTLVLVDGVRPALGGTSGTFADLSLVPAAAIERIEVLADGASALYGSDAVAGVVNLVPRRNLDGAETSGRFGAADGFSEYQLSQALGRRWSSGHAVVAYEFYRRDRLAAADRDYATEDLRRFGGLDYRSNYATPGTIVAGGRVFGIPVGQNGRTLTVAQLVADAPNRGDAWSRSDLLPRQIRHALYAAVDQDLGERLHLFATLQAAQRRFDKRTIPNLQPTTVLTANPFYLDPIGTGRPLSVRYDFQGDLGPERLSGRVRAYNSVIGATLATGAWSTTVTAGIGEQTERFRNDNQVNTYRLGLALADTNLATAYNVFGDPGSTPQATIDAIRGFTASRGRYGVWFAAGKADGPLFTLPAGQVRLAIGAEHRQERFKQTSLSDIRYAAPRAIANIYPPSRAVSAVYAELLVPITEQSAPFGRLDLSLAGRVERYDLWGSTSNPKVGLDWRPLRGLTLRGSYGTSFRAPSFKEQLIAPGQVGYQPITIPDPNAPSGQSTVLALLGNTPDIGPERAKTWTAGVDFHPAQLPGLRATATYYRINYRDRIANPNSYAYDVLPNRSVYASLIKDNPSLAEVESYYNSIYLLNYDGIPASAVQIILDLRLQNLSVVKQDGVDFQASYVTSVAGGEARVGLSGSYILGLSQRFTPTAPSIDVLGTVGAPTALRLRGEAGWSLGAWSANGFVNFVDGYRNQTVTPAQHVKAWTTVDLQLAYDPKIVAGPLAGVRAALSIVNLFDRDPPYAVLKTPTSVVGFNADGADPAGRLVALQVTKAW